MSGGNVEEIVMEGFKAVNKGIETMERGLEMTYEVFVASMPRRFYQC